MRDVTMQQMVDFLTAYPQATVMDVMAEFDLTEPEALEALRATQRFLEMPQEMQDTALRFWRHDDLDAHLADEFGADDDGELMDPLGATLTEEEQRERFGGYGRREE